MPDRSTRQSVVRLDKAESAMKRPAAAQPRRLPQRVAAEGADRRRLGLRRPASPKEVHLRKGCAAQALAGIDLLGFLVMAPPEAPMEPTPYRPTLRMMALPRTLSPRRRHQATAHRQRSPPSSHPRTLNRAMKHPHSLSPL